MTISKQINTSKYTGIELRTDYECAYFNCTMDSTLFNMVIIMILTDL